MSNALNGNLGSLVAAGGGKIHTGPFGSQLHASDYVPQGIPCIMPANMRNNRVDLSSIAFITEDDAQRLSKYIVKENDIVYSRRGDVTQKALIRKNEEGYFCGTGCLLLRPGKKFDARFLTYYLSTPRIQSWIVRQAVGATMPNLNTGILSSIPFHGPAKPEQERIANVLSAIDEKIELNNHINAELEAMAKALYDYWFVQFDFPDANGKPYKTSGGKMVYNQTLRREIPKMWRDSTIGAIEPNIVTGKTPSKDNPEYFGGNVPFITIGDIRGNTYIVSTEETLTDAGAATQKNKFLPEDSICVSCIASPGLVGFVTTPAQTNQQINSVVCGKEINKYYLYFAIKSYFEGAKAKTGNTFANMNKADFGSINILEPLNQVLKLYHEKADPLFRQIKLNLLENHQLSQLRDWLLPMLMNGQATVK